MQQLVVPGQIGECLVDMDNQGLTIMRRTPYSFSLLEVERLNSLRPLVFTPERGTVLGDIHSPFTLYNLASVFDVLLSTPLA